MILSPMSVTCHSDCCHYWTFKPKPFYFRHLAGGRVDSGPVRVPATLKMTTTTTLANTVTATTTKNGGDYDDHRGAAETNAGESNGDDCYLALFTNTTIRYVVTAMV